MEFNPEFTLKQLNVKLYIQNCKLLQRSLLLPGKCMEINCGSGYTTRYCLLPKLQPRSTIIGTDSSITMIEYARRNYRNNGQIDFKVLDIQTEHLPEEYIGQFDHIFSFPTVHARTNIFQEFENVYKMLKPGGSFHMCIVTIHDAFSLYRRMVNHPTFGSYFKV
ncbi:Juvenile hormone acid O-methyltransferase [Formica fusca]